MKLFIFLLSLLPTIALAQMAIPGMPQGMDPKNMANMQKMMVQLQKMEKCMENIDRSEMDKIKQQSEQAREEVNQLCQSGKRDQAQKKAADYAKRMTRNRGYIQAKRCMKSMTSFMPPMPFDQIEENLKTKGKHVCDK
ncbi:MAG: hypothetical protein ISR69_09800 [Gammaproteobacteria bacterium]|nr:hypothetical protein [Gammaproteobacteria bacterium]